MDNFIQQIIQSIMGAQKRGAAFYPENHMDQDARMQMMGANSAAPGRQRPFGHGGTMPNNDPGLVGRNLEASALPVEVVDVDPGSQRHSMENPPMPRMRPDGPMPDISSPGEALAALPDAVPPGSAGAAEGGTPPPPTGGGTSRTVARGDNLWKIAEQIVGDNNPQKIRQMVRTLAEMNGLKDANRIDVGQKLRLPGSNVGGGPRMRGAGRESDEEYG